MLTIHINLPKIELPSIGGGFSAKDLNGPYSNEFETLSATLDGKTDANYAMMIGKKSTMNGTIAMTDDKTGTMTFSGSSYGVDVKTGMPITIKGDQLEVNYEDTTNHSKLHYTGKLSKIDGAVHIDGSYETTITDPSTGKVIVVAGKWLSDSAKGTVSKNLDTSKAKKDVTLDQLQGTWSGKLVYAKIENLDQIPDVTEKDKEMARSMIGKTMNLKMKFEGDKLTLTMQDPNGGNSDMDDLPPITLSDGVFTTALTMTDKEGTGKMNLSGVIYDEGGSLKIKSELKMAMAFVKNTTMTVVITMDAAKDSK